MPRPLKVLVVDDYHDVGDSCAELLRLHGHDVRVARCCAEAVAVVGSFAPDLVLLDIGLPDGSGYELAGRLLAVLSRRPVLVAVTGFGHYEGRSRDAGFDFHFLKPLAPQQLTAAMDAATHAADEGDR
ncbi:response regulator [bacterium]|nr:response regulator [bacterium]